MEAGHLRKKRKGGIRQRQAAVDVEERVDSKLYAWLMMQLSWGLISASLCCEIAEAALADIDAVSSSQKFPQLLQLVRKTSSNSSNQWRAAKNAMVAESNLPMPYTVSMPYKDGDRSTSMLLPHELFAAMYADGDLWESTVFPPGAQIEAFWSAFGTHPLMEGHPVKRRALYQKKCVPLAFHGDEVPVTGKGKIWCKQALSLSWFSILANAMGACTLSVMVYVWGVFEKFVAPDRPGAHGTMQVFWNIMRWSFGVIYSGVWPAYDWRGVAKLGQQEHVCIICFGCLSHCWWYVCLLCLLLGNCALHSF